MRCLWSGDQHDAFVGDAESFGIVVWMVSPSVWTANRSLRWTVISATPSGFGIVDGFGGSVEDEHVLAAGRRLSGQREIRSLGQVRGRASADAGDEPVT